jgi:hypothetical protein
MQNTTSIDRRNFLRLTGITGAAFILGFKQAKSNGIPAIVNLSNRADLYQLTAWTDHDHEPQTGNGTGHLSVSTCTHC